RAPIPDVATMAAVLRDTRGVDDVMRPPGHRGVIDDGRAVHTVILDPMTLELWVADARSNGRFRGFDLRRELRGYATAVAAPPADVMPDPASDPDRLTNLAAARADLREAREALAKNDRARATEACARARARAPAFPEALELDAIIAQMRGDETRAHLMFQRWL